MIVSVDDVVVTQLCNLTATEQLALLNAGSASATEVLESHLERIEAVNPLLNAVISMDEGVARASAKRIDDARTVGDEVGPLAGLVTAHKDLAETVDFRTTFGSPAKADFVAEADDLLVARMKAAGAVAVGKTNTPEFGAGSHTFNPLFGVTRNAYNPERSAGGSSGGAAVALTTGMVGLADGSDLGGSLRNPAAWSNVVGFRASLGRVPNPGSGNAWPRLPVSGAMARTVDDLALMLDVITEFDAKDPMSRGLDVPAVIEPVSGSPRVAWSNDLGGLPVEDDVRKVLDQFRADVEALGWNVVDDEPDFEGADECFATIRSWFFANTSAGELSPEKLALTKDAIREEVERGRSYDGDAIAAAMAHLKVLWDRAVDFYENYDLMIGPVTQLSPFTIDQEFPEAVSNVSNVRYIDWMKSCCRVTSLQLPALSIPGGFTEAGLPVGAHIIGGPWADIDVLRAGKTLEAATNHGQHRPPLLNPS